MKSTRGASPRRQRAEPTKRNQLVRARKPPKPHHGPFLPPHLTPVLAAGTTYTFEGLTIYSGLEGNGGLRAIITVGIFLPGGASTTAYLNFCDAAYFNTSTPPDSTGVNSTGPYYFYFPVELLPTILSIIAAGGFWVGYTWSTPGGGTAIGEIGTNTARVEARRSGSTEPSRASSGTRPA